MDLKMNRRLPNEAVLLILNHFKGGGEFLAKIIAKDFGISLNPLDVASKRKGIIRFNAEKVGDNLELYIYADGKHKYDRLVILSKQGIVIDKTYFKPLDV